MLWMRSPSFGSSNTSSHDTTRSLPGMDAARQFNRDTWSDRHTHRQSIGCPAGADALCGAGRSPVRVQLEVAVSAEYPSSPSHPREVTQARRPAATSPAAPRLL